MLDTKTIEITPDLVAFCRLRAFAKIMNPKFDTTPAHIKTIAKALQDVENGKIKRLMIFMPPRHGKSLLSSEMFPAWYLGRNPDKNIIFAAYNQQFASDFGRSYCARRYRGDRKSSGHRAKRGAEINSGAQRKDD